jgi:hypothetical protein
MGNGSLLGVNRSGLGVDHTPHLEPMLKKVRAIPLLPLWAFVACYRMKFIFTFYPFNEARMESRDNYNVLTKITILVAGTKRTLVRRKVLTEF